MILTDKNHDTFGLFPAPVEPRPPRTPNRGRQPRCGCGLVATFPEHDHEIQKLKVALGKVMEERDAAHGNLRVAMASNKILQHDIEALQEQLRNTPSPSARRIKGINEEWD